MADNHRAYVFFGVSIFVQVRPEKCFLMLFNFFLCVFLNYGNITIKLS